MYEIYNSLRKLATSKDTEEVTHTEGVTLSRLVADVTSVEVPVHARLERRSLKVLHAIRDVRDDEPLSLVSRRKVMVNMVPLGDNAIRAESIDVVIRRPGPEIRVENASGNKLVVRMHNQSAGAGSDLKATLVNERSDIDHSLL